MTSKNGPTEEGGGRNEEGNHLTPKNTNNTNIDERTNEINHYTNDNEEEEEEHEAEQQHILLSNR